MKAVKLSRKLHKWSALLLGIQLFLWALSGFYMVVVHIDIIHGDMLVEDARQNLDVDQDLYISFDELLALHPDARRITLKTLIDSPVYVVEGENTLLLDAFSGVQVPPVEKETAARIASYHYRGAASIRDVKLLESDPPTELQARPLPLWRVDFDDKWNSTFYIDPTTGEFTTRRHTLWRVFDFLWMLHIMDYDSREDINNTVLRVFSALGLLAGLSGAWLLFYSFGRKKAQRVVA